MEAVKTNFKVIGLAQLGIKSKSTAPEADVLTTRTYELLHLPKVSQILELQKLMGTYTYSNTLS